MNASGEELIKLDKETIDRDIEIWKVAVDTQMHFNDLLIKMRTTVTSIILAVFGSTTIALKDAQWEVQILYFKIRPGALVLAIGLVFLVAQFVLDFFYYFKLLLGSVEFTKSIDEKYKKHRLFGLTESITKAIPSRRAKCILILYYAIPIVLSVAGIYAIQYGLTPLK